VEQQLAKKQSGRALLVRFSCGLFSGLFWGLFEASKCCKLETRRGSQKDGFAQSRSDREEHLFAVLLVIIMITLATTWPQLVSGACEWDKIS